MDVKTEEEDTDDETDNEQPPEVESNAVVKIKKEKDGSYADDTDDGQLKPPEVK